MTKGETLVRGMWMLLAALLWPAVASASGTTLVVLPNRTEGLSMVQAEAIYQEVAQQTHESGAFLVTWHDQLPALIGDVGFASAVACAGDPECLAENDALEAFDFAIVVDVASVAGGVGVSLALVDRFGGRTLGREDAVIVDAQGALRLPVLNLLALTGAVARPETSPHSAATIRALLDRVAEADARHTTRSRSAPGWADDVRAALDARREVMRALDAWSAAGTMPPDAARDGATTRAILLAESVALLVSIEACGEAGRVLRDLDGLGPAATAQRDDARRAYGPCAPAAAAERAMPSAPADWILVGGAVAVTGGLLLGFAADSVQQEIQARPHERERLEQLQSRGQRRQVAGNVLLFGGGAAMGTGIVLRILDRSNAAEAPQASVVPLRGGAAVWATGRF